MSGWVVEGWHVLVVFGTGVVCGLLLGAKLTVDTLREHGWGLPDYLLTFGRSAPGYDDESWSTPETFRPPPGPGTDVFPQAATDDEPDHPSLLPPPDYIRQAAERATRGRP